ncbi:MAG: deoxyribodipyrimidine photo-lyase [Ilumatobacteraceae bacterium]
MPRSVLWFRRDLRLADLPALAAAHELGDVVPLFVVDPTLLGTSGAPRLAHMVAVLQALDDELGGTLVYRHGDPVDVVPALADELSADHVFVTRDHGPYGRARDASVAQRLAAAGRQLHGVGSNYLVDPGTVTKADGTPYAVFTPFSKVWRPHAEARRSSRPATPSIGDVSWVGAPEVPCDGPLVAPRVDASLPSPASASAHRQWDAFVANGLDDYDERRNLPAVPGTSRLSPALRWGVMHPAQLADDLGPSRSHEVFLSELAWREFYADVLFRRPETARVNLNPKMDSMPIDTDVVARARFERWATGTTGFPIVDAGMRQLLATGWMHNRVRMITGSFLVKDLHLPWQWGARHFMRHLVDGDLASNSHGWQWVAGSGTDAAPYFRIFNPTSQSERFDPAGDYIRQWVPELAAVRGGAVHQPGVLRPDAYPAPMVDHAVERDDALARYRAMGTATR